MSILIDVCLIVFAVAAVWLVSQRRLDQCKTYRKSGPVKKI